MSIYQHFRPEEKPFVDRAMDWTETVRLRNHQRITPFLDPREQFILQSIVSKEDSVQLTLFGGYDLAERKRAVIAPDYLTISKEDAQISLLAIEPEAKAVSFAHRDVLGSLMGLGVKREIFGDILLSKSLQVLVMEEFTDYIKAQLTHIHRYPVRCESICLTAIQAVEEDWSYRTTTVSSLRLDAILSELTPLSRSKSLALIQAGRVKLNWKVEERPACQVEEGDVLSVKGYGRFLLAEIQGETKKQKLRVTLGKKGI